MRRQIMLFRHKIKERGLWVQARLPRVRETVRTYVVYLAVTALLLVLSFSLLTYHAWRDYRGAWNTPGATGRQEQNNATGKAEEFTKPVAAGQISAAKSPQPQQTDADNRQGPERKPAGGDVHAKTGKVQSEKLVKPLSGTIMTAYGWQEDALYKDWRFFPGVDVQAASGSEVRAAKSGQVTDVSGNDRGFKVRITHPDGMVTVYGHLAESYLAPGQSVRQGQTIGRLGKAGEASLHFEVWQDNRSIDPSDLFGRQGPGSRD